VQENRLLTLCAAAGALSIGGASGQVKRALQTQCAHCQHGNSLTAGFCAECGQRLPRACPARGFAVAPAAKFCAECGQRQDTVVPPVQAAETFPTPQAYTPRYLAEKLLTSRHALEGEDEHVTVLFADIKGSTELIEGLDPEEARRLLDPALHVRMDAVHRFEGTVNQVLGDGIMALFGAPITHEDHALRARYPALAMQAAMQSYTDGVRRGHGLTLRIRAGLNSGEVMVRAIGNDLHMDYPAVGQTTHLAVRMEQLRVAPFLQSPCRLLHNARGLSDDLRIDQAQP
jgi:class 3 adenylate cyclase